MYLTSNSVQKSNETLIVKKHDRSKMK